MASEREITFEMDALEEEAVAVQANPALTLIEKRLAFERLLTRYRVLEDYRKALAAYIRRRMAMEADTRATAEDIAREILSSPEFTVLRLAVFAIFLAVVYGDGPRAAWVPFEFLPVVSAPVIAFRL